MTFDGLLFFPVTPCDEEERLDLEMFRRHVRRFLPDLALACYRALRDGRDDVAGRLIEGFYRPLADLRREGPGYAVSLVKAGVRLRGLDVGPVRRPLADPSPEHLTRLAALIDRGLALLEELERSPDPA
ncbi:MAG: hypothetical protein IRZ07_25005 [Microbispora sp.]|nr:hypothetical protein [Microbispora sp.]